MGPTEILFKILKYVQILVLGICMGIPLNFLMIISSVIWNKKNQSKFDKPKNIEYSTLERNSINLDNGIKLDYFQTKEASDKVAVFLHGFPDSASSWRYYMDKLTNVGYQSLAPNQRGYGRSSKPEGKANYDIDFLVSDIVNFIEKKTKKNTKVTLVMHDWGSAVGYQLARNYPELVENIIAINAISMPCIVKCFQENPKQIFASFYFWFFQLPYLPELVFSVSDWAVFRRLSYKIGTPIDELEDNLTGFGGRENPDTIHYAINWYRANMDRSNDLIMNPETKLIPHNVLMLWGDQDTALLSKTPEIESTFISGVVKIVHFPNASHNLHQQEKENVWEEMVAYLTR